METMYRKIFRLSLTPISRFLTRGLLTGFHAVFLRARYYCHFLILMHFNCFSSIEVCRNFRSFVLSILCDFVRDLSARLPRAIFCQSLYVMLSQIILLMCKITIYGIFGLMACAKGHCVPGVMSYFRLD